MDRRKNNPNERKIWQWLIWLLLAGFFCIGLSIFRNYGASSDEYNQIQAGHITWAAVCERLGCPVPDFGNLPKLEDYYNRFYGQAATFPTVIIEALRGFSLDVSTILRLRHLWNFLLYFCGLCSLAVLAKQKFHRDETVFLLLLLHMLTPRLFGDVFYNDRDVLLISLLWIALLSFHWFSQKPGIFQALLCGLVFAIAINTRYFALILLLLPVFYLVHPENSRKRNAALVFLFTLLFFYLITPVFWGGFLPRFAEGFRTFSSGVQRTQETAGAAKILFFGKKWAENALPFYYLPLWIFISTPLIPQLLAAVGLVTQIREKRDILDRFMLLFLCGGIAAVMLICPVLYNGWRHMYFFYVPLFWFAGRGIDFLLVNRRRLVGILSMIIVLLSAGWSGVRIASLHPYEMLYLNPLFQSREAEFDRDYWRLSTYEVLNHIVKDGAERIRISDINANLDNSLIALFPGQRERIIPGYYQGLHRVPADFVLFNYSGTTENEKTLPLYESEYIVERDGVKLAEAFQRKFAFVPEIETIEPDMPEIMDGVIDLEHEWRSDEPQNNTDEIRIEFIEIVSLRGLSLLPGDDEREYARSPEVCVSDDGMDWKPLPLTISGLYDLSFPQTETRFLRIRNTEDADVHWSVREILFYE